MEVTSLSLLLLETVPVSAKKWFSTCCITYEHGVITDCYWKLEMLLEQGYTHQDKQFGILLHCVLVNESLLLCYLLNNITRRSFTGGMSNSWLIDLHKIDLYVLAHVHIQVFCKIKHYGSFLFSVHNAVVTTAVFAPNPQHFLATDDCSSSRKSKDATLTPSTANTNAEFVISADISGCIKVIRAK